MIKPRRSAAARHRAAALGLLALALTGCTSPDPAAARHPGASLVIVVGVHANELAPGVPLAAGQLLIQAVNASEPVGVVTDQGQPYLLRPATALPVTNANTAAHASDVQTGVADIVALVNAARATTNGSDLLAAVGLAADTAHAVGSSNPTILVIDSGLTDTGELQTATAGLLGLDPNQVADYLAATHDLPALAGARVELVGIGYTSPPQAPLDIAQRAALTRIWQVVFQRAGASVTIIPVPRTGAGPRTPYTTRTVSFPAPAPLTPTPGRTYTLTDASAVGFRFNSTQLRDPAGAAAVLGPIAGWLAADPARRAVLQGTSDSTGDPGYDLTLSLRRAQALAAILIAMGAPATSITAQGAGYIASPPDTGPGGSVNPARAALNRSVRITLYGPGTYR